MARWTRRRGGSEGDDLARADALYRKAIERSHQPGQGDRAERLSAEAVAAYRRAQEAGDGHDGFERRRRLGLALWRYSMLLGARGRPEDALEPGREGIALAAAVLDEAGQDHPERDALAGELATAMNDLSETAAAAGRRDEQAELLEASIGRCVAATGPRARQALGTALHNQAVATANAGGADRPAVIVALNEVVVLRRELRNAGLPMTYWELANSLLLRGRLNGAVDRPEAAGRDLLDAWTTLEGVSGPSVDSLRHQVRAAMHELEMASPTVVARLAWPWAPAAGETARTGEKSPEWARTMAEALRLMEAGDTRRAVDVLEPLAEAGDADAMHTLALVYVERGASRTARGWFRRGAEAGNVDSMVQVGCEAAAGGRIDEAARLLQAAAAAGSANGEFNYGMLLVQHRQQPAEGMRQWESAAAKGHALAALNLGNLSYQQGRPAEAERWFRRAAELGNTQAMHNLAMVLHATGRFAEAARWVAQAERT